MAANGKTLQQIIDDDFEDPHIPEHQLGPDHILPSDNIRTWLPSGTVKLEVPSNEEEFFKPVSTVTLIKKTVDEFPDKCALAVNRDDQWVKWTYKDYWNDIRTAAKGFIKLGLMPYHGVGILGFNAPEWMISFAGGIFAGGISAGIYTTNSPEACHHILLDSNANIAIVENDTQLQKILKFKDKLPNLKAIIQYLGTPSDPSVFSWKDLLAIGKSVPDEVLERRIKGLAINQCSHLIYTSGTTGNAKGVMLSHDNLIVTAKRYTVTFPLVNHEVFVSYLPLSHMAALSADFHLAIVSANTVYFAPPDALRGKLVETLTEIRPTVVLGVPRVFEKIYEKLVETEDLMTPAKRNFMVWARNQVLQYHTKKPHGKTLGYRIAKKIVCDRVKKLLGFDKVHVLFAGGAPMPVEVLKYFLSLDMLIEEGYGLSESGLVASNTANDYRVGSVGKITPTMKATIKINNPDENGNGEILISDRITFMGYLGLEDKTAEAIDDQRWLHTGDQGMIDGDNYLYITGRVKELLITSGGENVPPVPIETTMKKFLPAISNCILIGDRKKYLILLITLKVEIDPVTNIPTDRLTPGVIKWCKDIGSKVETVSEILKNEDTNVMEEIQAAVSRYNKEEAISGAQKIQKWKILREDFSIGGGELGPTGKVRRPFVVQKYSQLIASMYSK